MQRVEIPSATNSALIARIIANEVDLFMDREKGGSAMDQKALRQLERDIEQILLEDPRIGGQMMSKPAVKQQQNTERRDYSQGPTISKSHNGRLMLPKINSGLNIQEARMVAGSMSLTPARGNNVIGLA